MKQWERKMMKKKHHPIKCISLVSATFVMSLYAEAQTADGNTGIKQATSMVKGYFDASTHLMYAIGAIVGLVGAVKVYQKWSNGHPDTGSTAALI